HLPAGVRLVSLSATVSNAEEFGDWLQAVRGDTDVVVSEERPVPLEQHVLVRSRLVDLLDTTAVVHGETGARVNPELLRLTAAAERAGGARYRGRGRGGGRGGGGAGGRGLGERLPRPEVVRLLRGRTLLPAIFFVFSRAGCDA